MKYKKDDDNRYRVRFMRATEELMDAMTVKGFISYLQEAGEFEDTDTMYLDGHIVDTKVYMLREAPDLRKEFIITEDGRVFYWLSLIQKIELVDREDTQVSKVSRYEIINTVTGKAVGVEESTNRWRAKELAKSKIPVRELVDMELVVRKIKGV